MTPQRRSSTGRTALVLLTSVFASTALLIGLAGPAAAEIEVDAPDQVTVGTETEVTAVVAEDGAPLAGVDATLSFVGRIAGKSGWVDVASGVTDDSGSVTFTYQQTAFQGERMRVEYTDLEGRSQTSPFEVLVVDSAQQHASSAGASLPIFGVWWLLIVIGIIWTMVLVAALGIVTVGRTSDLAHGPVRALPRFAFGLVAFTAIGMFIVILSRPTMHANLDPTADFGRVPPALVGTEYEYVGLSNDSEVASRAGATGQELYIQANCVGCHGVGGFGAVVGPALVEADDPDGINLNSFIEEVREGPKEMPTYGESRLSDEEITRIHDYLFRSGTS